MFKPKEIKKAAAALGLLLLSYVVLRVPFLDLFQNLVYFNLNGALIFLKCNEILSILPSKNIHIQFYT